MFPKIVVPQIIHFNEFSIINHPFWGIPIFGNPQTVWDFFRKSHRCSGRHLGNEIMQKNACCALNQFTKENDVVHTHYNIWYLKTQISACFVATHLLPRGLPSLPIQAPIWSSFHQRCQLVMSSAKWKDDSVQGPSKECPKWMVRGAIQ